MDLNPNGRSYRYNDNVYQYQAVSGDFYKLTFAPTFKVGDVFDIKARPEIRFFVTWMNWDKDLDRYAINDDFGSKGFTAGGTGTSACRRRFGSDRASLAGIMPATVRNYML
jgi:sucrose porin